MKRNGALKTCVSCKASFYVPKCRLKSAKFCSYKCGGDFLRGKPVSPDHLLKLRAGFKRRVVPSTFKKGHQPWHKDVPLKGDQASYSAIHYWIRKRKGRAAECVRCENPTAKRYEWANKYHSVSRNLDDYIALCSSCHVKFDAH